VYAREVQFFNDTIYHTVPYKYQKGQAKCEYFPLVSTVQ